MYNTFLSLESFVYESLSLWLSLDLVVSWFFMFSKQFLSFSSANQRFDLIITLQNRCECHFNFMLEYLENFVDFHILHTVYEIELILPPQLFLSLWFKACLRVLDLVSWWASSFRCAWSSRMLWSGQELASSVVLRRPLLSSLWSSCSCGFLFFYTGAYTTPICRMRLFPQRCTTIRGRSVNSPAPAKRTLHVLLCLPLQVRLWITCILLLLLSTGKCVYDEEQEACMYDVCVH